MTLAGQLDLIDWLGRARVRDPFTSKEAAASVDRFASHHFKLILQALEASPLPLSAEQIADACGLLDFTQVGKRSSELLRAGRIEVAEGDQHVNRSGRRAQRYKLVGAV